MRRLYSPSGETSSPARHRTWRLRTPAVERGQIELADGLDGCQGRDPDRLGRRGHLGGGTLAAPEWAGPRHRAGPDRAVGGRPRKSAAPIVFWRWGVLAAALTADGAALAVLA